MLFNISFHETESRSRNLRRLSNQQFTHKIQVIFLDIIFFQLLSYNVIYYSITLRLKGRILEKGPKYFQICLDFRFFFNFRFQIFFYILQILNNFLYQHTVSESSSQLYSSSLNLETTIYLSRLVCWLYYIVTRFGTCITFENRNIDNNRI